MVKEMKATDKIVSVDVSKSSDGMRTIKVVTDNNGEKEVMEWTDNGEIPDEIKEKLEAQNINLHLMDESDGENVFIEVDNDGVKKVRKEVVVIKKSDGDALVEYEWDGSGDMPEEMKELLDEHDIELEDIHEGHGDKKVRIRKMKDKHAMMRNKAKKRGRAYNAKEKQKFKVITIDEDGNESEMEWEEEGDGMNQWIGDDDVHVFHMDRGRRMRGPRGNSFMWISDDDEKHLSDAYMGAQIESDENGAKILDVMKDSPADKAGLTRGDIVQRINGARSRSMDDLLSILTFYEPNDKVELVVLRDGKEKKLNLTLGKRPDSYR